MDPGRAPAILTRGDSSTPGGERPEVANAADILAAAIATRGFVP
jgi:hypothetical protein